MKVLISGFEPFDHMPFNPSQELMKSLELESFDFELSTIVLPVSFSSSFSLLKKRIEEFKPDVIIGTGLASSRVEVTVERVAINIIEARIADNDGERPQRKTIIEGASDGLFTQLPIQAMVSSALKDQLPAAVSNTAGTYVCNYLMYCIVQFAREHGLKGGFIHLPPSKELSPKGLDMKLISTTVAKMLRAINDPENMSAECGVED